MLTLVGGGFRRYRRQAADPAASPAEQGAETDVAGAVMAKMPYGTFHHNFPSLNEWRFTQKFRALPVYTTKAGGLCPGEITSKF
ncbi:hypothetical protein KCP73_10440 [Salmonella enterica subsp. enterica]|nr:hypothetical protein KCP73_10440 [Salmonella enterica subsp. enterica]